VALLTWSPPKALLHFRVEDQYNGQGGMLDGPFGGKAQGANECKRDTKKQFKYQLKATTTALNCF
jgi:hypothetical protein